MTFFCSCQLLGSGTRWRRPRAVGGGNFFSHDLFQRISLWISLLFSTLDKILAFFSISCIFRQTRMKDESLLEDFLKIRQRLVIVSYMINILNKGDCFHIHKRSFSLNLKLSICFFHLGKPCICWQTCEFVA